MFVLFVGFLLGLLFGSPQQAGAEGRPPEPVPVAQQENQHKDDAQSLHNDEDDSAVFRDFLLLLALLLLWVLPVLVVATFCHELGHAVMAWVVGIRITAFGMGTGRPYSVYNWRGVRIYFGLQRPLQGLAYIYPQQILISRVQAVGVLLGGVFAHLLLGLLGLGLWVLLPWLNLLWVEVVVGNFLFALVNVIPFSLQIGAYRAATDGTRILTFLRTGVLECSAPAHLGMYKLLHRLLDQIGDRIGSLLLLQGAAGNWREMGVMERADELSKEVIGQLDALPESDQASCQVSQSMLACQAGRLEEATVLLQQAKQTFRTLNHQAGLFFVRAAEVEIHQAKGELREALAVLDELAAHPAARRLGVRIDLIASRLGVVTSLGESAEIQKLRTEYERLRRTCLSLTRDLRVYRALGRWYMARESWLEAASVYRLVLKALETLHKSLDNDEQNSLLAAHAKLLAEITNALRQAGRLEEADAIETLFISAADPRRQALEARQRRDRRWSTLGGWITAGNLLLGLAGMAGMTPLLLRLGPQRGPWVALLLALPALLWTFGAIGLFIRIIGRLVGYFAPSLRYKVGIVEVVIGLVCWFMLVVLAMLAITVAIVLP